MVDKSNASKKHKRPLTLNPLTFEEALGGQKQRKRVGQRVDKGQPANQSDNGGK